MELPANFTHESPKGCHYEVQQFKRNVVSIWFVYDGRFDYNNHDAVRCIWGFYNTKTKEYYSPKNSTTVGDVVDINHTTKYSAMTLNRKGLESLWM